jgi:hypothetical protein
VSRTRRPQVRRGTAGQRVVLVAPRADLTGPGMATLLEQVAAARWTLTAVVEPSDWRSALRMVADGLADVLATTRPEHLPAVQLVHGIGAMVPPSTPEPARKSSAPAPAEQPGKPRRRTVAKRSRVLQPSTPLQPERVSTVPTPLPIEPNAPSESSRTRRPNVLRGAA